MAKPAILILLVITFYRCFWNLGAAHLEKWDENTNVSVISETLSRKSFPVLYLSGKPFFEKPPLWYYSNLLLPQTPRVISAAAGFFMILLTVYIGWKWWGNIAGFATWIVLLTTNQLFVNNPGGIYSTHTFRSADSDALFMLFIVLSFYTKNSVYKGIFSGLAVLTKGPLGMLPLIIAPPIAWLTAISVAAPWYLYMTVRFGNAFLIAHIGYHLIERTFTPIEGHINPPWYYLQLLTNRNIFMSWEILLGSVIWLIATIKTGDQKTIYTVIMTILLFLIPTFMQTKLAWYILPMYPFAALTIGAAAQSLVGRPR